MESAIIKTLGRSGILLVRRTSCGISDYFLAKQSDLPWGYGKALGEFYSTQKAALIEYQEKYEPRRPA